MKRYRSDKKRVGMTLVEVMAVLLIMGLVATVATISVLKAIDGSNKRATKVKAASIQSAAIAYTIENPRSGCPTVEALSSGGILDPTKDNKDAWGNDFSIECDGEIIRVYSPGKDGQFNTDDDIRS